MVKKFRQEIRKGVHSFTWNNRLYQVLDDITIYHPDSEMIYYKDLDF